MENKVKLDKCNIEKVEKILDIFITTYNRSDKLAKTLDYFANSPFRTCSITIFNNASTDDTLDMINSKKQLFADLKVITHPINIGGDANIIRTVEYCTKEYMWIVHDDDNFDFSDCQDLMQILCEGKVGLIHVGAHVEPIRNKFSGKLGNIKDFMSCGYPYFKFSSFTPCNIFKYQEFIPFVRAGHENIHNHYAIMPFLISKFENNDLLYITKKQICKASVGGQCYNFTFLVKSWYGTSFLFKKKEDRRNYFSEQFSEHTPLLLSALYRYYLSFEDGNNLIFRIFYSYLNVKEKMLFKFLCLPYVIYKKIKMLLKN